MKLLYKFNLVFILVGAIGSAGAGLVARDMLQQQARDEVLNTGRLLIDTALAVRGYTSGQITNLLQTQLEQQFHPQAVPSYSATEVHKALSVRYPDYSYKEATINPTNLRDKAEGWEVDIVQKFKQEPELKEYVGVRESPSTGRALYVARPLRVGSAACLVCHSSVEAAPKSLVEKYGPANGFGWQLNEVVGAQVVQVPMELPLKRADAALRLLLTSLLGVFVAVGLVLNLMIWWFVVRPVTRLATLADRVSQGDLDAPPFDDRARDEIGTLAAAFARMRTSVTKAMKLLEQG